MTSFRRLEAGGHIDRGRTVRARYDGKPLAGFAGDTLASALLAGNHMLIGRSFKYHRPRGILSAGVEEPNALFTLGEGARTYLAETFASLGSNVIQIFPGRRETAGMGQVPLSGTAPKSIGSIVTASRVCAVR